MSGTDNPGGFAASDAFSFTLNGVELPYKPGQKFNITLVIGGGIVAEPVA